MPIIIFLISFFTLSVTDYEPSTNTTMMETYANNDTAMFGGGCFWCIEAIFEQIKGVKEVVSGYAGGSTKNPTYGQVCSGETGHAEVCRIIFDPETISYAELLLIFFSSHDPTTQNRQGADYGTQYRSIIFYHDVQQQKIAEKVIKTLTEQKVYEAPIVTEVIPETTFYPAENNHQQYYQNNSSQPYCTVVINPKLTKLRKNFSKYLK